MNVQKISIIIASFIFCLTTIAQDTIVFIDSFDNNKNEWRIESTGDYNLEIKNGEYYFKNKSKNTTYSTKKEIVLNQDKDIIISTSICLKSLKTNIGHGLIWGATDTEEFNFLINKSRQFCVTKWSENMLEYLIAWSDSKVFVSEGYNILSIHKINKTLKFYVNNIYVGRIPFEPFFGNNIGFIATGKANLKIDYIEIEEKENKYPNYGHNTSLRIDSIKFLTTDKDTFLTIGEKGYLMAHIYNEDSIPAYEIEALIVPVDAPDDLPYDIVLNADTLKPKEKMMFLFQFDPKYFTSRYLRTYRLYITHINSSKTLIRDFYLQTKENAKKSVFSKDKENRNQQSNNWIEPVIVGIPLTILLIMLIF